MSRLVERAMGKVRRSLATSFRRRELTVNTPTPLVSFSFDDAPRSAFERGARIVEEAGARATYYVSLGLLNSRTELGAIAGPDDLARAVEAGHELGCHTFHHYDAWTTPRREYLASVDRNQRALTELLPGHTFRSFAYPKSGAVVWVKSHVERRFECCRGGSQATNAGLIDLNLLSACFLDRRTGIDLDFVRALIDTNAEVRGWLIFAAHDISDTQEAFCCSPGFLETVVRRAVDCGAEILPVAAACARLRLAGRAREAVPERLDTAIGRSEDSGRVRAAAIGRDRA